MSKTVSRVAFFCLIFTLACKMFTLPISAGSFQDDVDASADDASANIAKFNFESVKSFWSVAGCTFLAAGCVDKGGNPIIEEGAFESGGKAVAHLITTPPVHTATYVADVIQNLRLPGVEPVYAQGIGFSALSPVLRIWKAFRNLAYFIYIVVFVVIGFMIMFRKKISSNAVMTIQEALPKLIVTLLLITFSYAIAGLVIDLIYVVILVVLGLLKQFDIISDITKTKNAVFGYSIFRIAFSYLIGTNETAGEASQAVSYLVGGALGLGRLGTWITNGLAYLIIAVGLVIAMFRTLFQLVTAYIGIIVSVIFAPIQLLTNAFPGSDAFEKWIRGLIANAAVFPAVAIVLILGAAIVGVDDSSKSDFGLPGNTGSSVNWGNGGWVPPLIMTQVGVANSNGPDTARGIIGIGMIFLLPEIVKIVKEALKVKDQYGEMAFKNGMAGYEKSGMKGLANLPGKYVSTIGNYAMNFAALDGTQKALSGAGKFGDWWRDHSTRTITEMGLRPPVATPKQAGEKKQTTEVVQPKK